MDCATRVPTRNRHSQLDGQGEQPNSSAMGKRIRPGITTGSEEPEAPEERAAGELRQALALWPSGVAVVTVRADGRVHGLTVSAFSSVSLDPPLVLICLSDQTPLFSYVREVGRFTINFLAENQKRTANVFSDRFPVGGPVFPEEGDPVLSGAVAALVCSLEATHPGGDHGIVVGRVQRVELGEDAAPLLHYRSEYRALGGRDSRG